METLADTPSRRLNDLKRRYDEAVQNANADEISQVMLELEVAMDSMPRHDAIVIDYEDLASRCYKSLEEMGRFSDKGSSGG